MSKTIVLKKVEDIVKDKELDEDMKMALIFMLVKSNKKNEKKGK